MADAKERSDGNAEQKYGSRNHGARDHRLKLKVTRSVPAAESMASLNSHQPPMLKRTPSISYTPPPSARVTRGCVGRPWPCSGMPPSTEMAACSTGRPCESVINTGTL